ncbi:TPA: GntR family transcriptional regulator [Raoultella planticola]|uniref:GntR family transcriptional regulator n=1 Tax=Citrobacter amalonaticus Y19 TaxID=1261127 RepID=A0A0F6TV88_CITAM|nr:MULTISPECIES: GntR family transcriptional regulator [Enterobacteriaceae]EHK4263118.1 GntR family transcriptional regulator [Escherichia coli]QLX87577.1 GntR family transcriptional regulator [Klebsiella oxytoca]HCR1854612.1 GntR family transcriptional regulator [Enterobacter kobei]HDZ0418736.1 GntR family transcriptional regulator [Klebsiella quasipneumoniae]AKE58944.1 GntR family transcriptional regulator [Citrobacter amalonaticus Y19]
MDTGLYIKENFRFNDDAGTSMYSQLASFIRHQVRLGVFRVNDKMVTENELCDILKISRTTVRLAMNELLEEGLIVRQRGKGSFIADKKINRKLNSLYNFSDSMREQGIKPHSVVLQSAIIEADEVIATKLNLPEGQRKIFLLKRVRYGDDTPLLLETTAIPYNLCQGIELHDFEASSLYDVLKNQFGLNIAHATENIDAIIINKPAAHHLQCNDKVMAGYQIERISFLETGFVFEYTTSVTRADKCSFRIDLFNANQNAGKSRIDFSRHLKR